MNFCTNEHILISSPGGLGEAIPLTARIAWATDGAAAAGSWTVTSASVDFAARGVEPGMLALVSDDIRGPLGSRGTLFVVESVGSGELTLRRPGFDPGVGEPPGGSTGISEASVVVFDLTPQIADVSYRMAARFGIDEALDGRQADDLVDTRVLRAPCQLRVLAELYRNAWREGGGDIWKEKAHAYDQEAHEIERMVTLRWRASGFSPTTSLRNARLSR